MIVGVPVTASPNVMVTVWEVPSFTVFAVYDAADVGPVLSIVKVLDDGAEFTVFPVASVAVPTVTVTVPSPV